MQSHMLHLLQVVIPLHVVLAIDHPVGGLQWKELLIQFFVFVDESDPREIQ